jgi:hypothetical protein
LKVIQVATPLASLGCDALEMTTSLPLFMLVDFLPL